jgi:membrane dipeptidase
MRPRLALPFLALALAAPALGQTPEQTAAAALKAAPVFDGHNDVPGALRERRRNLLDGFDFRDTTNTAAPDKDQAAMHTDLNRLRQGKVGAQFWSVYVAATLPEPQAVQAVMEQIDVTKRLIARYPAELQYATDAAGVERALKAGRIASLLGMEGGYAIGQSLGVLRQFRELGVRYMTLTHTKAMPWADSATDKAQHGGLTDFGRDVVREMQRVGMLVDLSHVSEETMLDALEVAKAPVIFSHSGARAIASHPRNVPDSVLDRLKANGGVVMIVTLPAYVSNAVRDASNLRVAEKARLEALHVGNPEAAKTALAEWDRANPAPRATIAQVADHIDHVVRRAGIDHVGLGGDYDGMDSTVQGMEDVSKYPALFVELARRGYSQADLEKIASRNMICVLRAADAYAAAHQGDPPIENPTAF